MKTNYFIVLILVLLLNSFNSAAQTQAEMNQTAYDDYKKADAELNKVYKEVLQSLNKKEKQLLIKAQKDWIKFRDSHCEFVAEEFNGGSIQPLIRYTCLTGRTESRTEDLKEKLKEYK